jgi:catechol 2,3-dioxygenase-like lactoylglutathione lyase family enzyme
MEWKRRSEELVRTFVGICIITRDVRRLCDFYRHVLQVEAEGEGVFAALSTRGAKLSLFAEPGMEEMAPGSVTAAGRGGCVIEFEVEDVDREYERLAGMNVPIVKPPTTQPWGLRSVWFRDPDGNLVNFFAKVAGA